MSKMKDLNSMDGRTLALLTYVSRYSKEQVFNANGLYKDFPFAKHLFATRAEELEDIFENLASNGFLAIQDANLKTYKLQPGLKSEKVWPVAYAKLINIDRSFVRDRILKLIIDIPLHDFLELEQFQGDQNFSDPFLNAFADDQRVGCKGWWSTVCTLANLYDNVDRTGTVSELLLNFAKTAELKLEAESNDASFSKKINKNWNETGIVGLKASVDNITPWKINMAIQVILVRWADISIERRDKIKNDALRVLLKDAAIAHMILPVGHPDKQDEEMLESTQLIIFAPEDNKEIFINSKPADRFRELLRERMDIELLSPYQVTGFVPEVMFFGRNEQLRLIAAHPETNYAIYGRRQSGKSSLMKQLERLYKEQQPVAFINSELVFCEANFFTLLSNALNIQTALSYADFEDAAKSVEHGTLILIDEIDHVLETCDPKRILSALRHLNGQYAVRCILAGTTELYKQYRDIKSPMYNFADPLPLGPLTKLEAMELAREPMLSLGVVYEKGNSTIKQLVNYCGRFPNLIQLMCHQLVKEVKRKEVRKITSAMLDQVFCHNAFVNQVYQQFLHNFDSYQKLIVYASLMVKSMSLNLITERVQKYYDLSINRIEQLLDELVLLFVFEKSGATYKWSYEGFPTILKNQIRGVEFMIEQTIMEIKGEMKDK